MLVTLRTHYELGGSSDFSLSALMTRSETTGTNVSVYHLLSVQTLQTFLPRDSTSNSRSASAPSGPLVLRVLVENFSRPFLPTPRDEKRSPVLEEIQFPFTTVALPLFFPSKGRIIKVMGETLAAGVCLAEGERRILESLVRQRLLTAMPMIQLIYLAIAHVRFARLARGRVVLRYESILFRVLCDDIYLAFAQDTDPHILSF